MGLFLLHCVQARVVLDKRRDAKHQSGHRVEEYKQNHVIFSKTEDVAQGDREVRRPDPRVLDRELNEDWGGVFEQRVAFCVV